MKLLLGACVWGGSIPGIEANGHDVVWAGNWAKDPGDDVILATAEREGRVLITLDKDFGELAVVHNRPHGGIIRLVDISATQQGRVCCHVLARLAGELEQGAIVTAEPTRLRVRPRQSPGDD